jgi:hypothetical protein
MAGLKILVVDWPLSVARARNGIRWSSWEPLLVNESVD